MKRVIAALLVILPAACTESDLVDPKVEPFDAPTGEPVDETQDQILFVSNRAGIYSVSDIFRTNVDGNGFENLTQAPTEHYGWLTPSPDGSRIAFTSDLSGCYNIWVMNPDGTDRVQLTSVDQYERCNETPYWSPDGSQIAFISSREPSEGWQTYVMNADGSNPRKVSVVPDRDDAAGAGPLGWTPDGRVIYQIIANSADTIYVVEPDGTGAEPLFDEPGIRDPVWSPDGSLLAFVRSSDGVARLVVRDGAGSEDTLVVMSLSETGSYMAIPPAARQPWSPDGSWVAFYIAEHWVRQIFVIDTDGTDLRRLTDSERTSWFNAWSPDGTGIAFSSDPSGASDVYLINADGTGLFNLTDSPAEDSDALWLPPR
jgi:TolB protein